MLEILVCVLCFYLFAVSYASFSFLLLVIIRFLVYWLITTFDLKVSILYVLQHSQPSVAKGNRNIKSHLDPQIVSETLASQLQCPNFVVLPWSYCKTVKNTVKAEKRRKQKRSEESHKEVGKILK